MVNSFIPQVHLSGDRTPVITKYVERLNCTCFIGIGYPIPAESYSAALTRTHISFICLFFHTIASTFFGLWKVQWIVIVSTYSICGKVLRRHGNLLSNGFRNITSFLKEKCMLVHP